jgi:hypothetical protein
LDRAVASAPAAALPAPASPGAQPPGLASSRSSPAARLNKDELGRRAPRTLAASEAERIGAKQEYDARLAECNRLAELCKQADKASKGATAEFASTARGDVG